MKKYKLKEEVKKYLDPAYNGLGKSWDDWNLLGITKEAIEEVDEKVEVYFVHDRDINYWLAKSHSAAWTSQERKDIEWFLNEFSSKEELSFLVDKYVNYNELNGCLNFIGWLDSRIKGLK